MTNPTPAPIRAILAGCGSISNAWLNAAQNIPGLEIVGLVDLVENLASQRATQFGLEHAATGDNLPRMLDRLQPDVVLDCTVPEAHVDVTLTALSAGCHVLGEKPLADTMENARRMVEAAMAARRVYAVMQNRRYDANIRALRAYIETGEMGALTTLNSDFYLAPHFGGFRDRMQHVLLLDMAIHTFDQARLLSGADPVSVYCKEWNPSGSWYAHGASAVAVFEMTDGLVYTYRGSWCAEGLSTTWESDWRLIGERGTARWDGGVKMTAEVAGEVKGFDAEHFPREIPPYTGPKVGGHEGLIRDFVDCLRTGRTPETICTNNIHSLAMVFGAIASAETGRVVDLATL